MDLLNKIMMELDIRINKLKLFEVEEESPERREVQKIRRQEYENFKSWIEAQNNILDGTTKR